MVEGAGGSMLGTIVAALAVPAAAADGTSLWLREFVGVVVQPAGVMGEVTAEVRTPILRYGGVAFNDTFAGIGLRLGVTPVHVDTAVRVDLQPIDLLPLTFEVFRSTYWESPWGLVPTDRVAGQRMADRRPAYQADLDSAGVAYGFTASPTVQMRLGPVAAFSNVALTWLAVRPTRRPEKWIFEPYRGMVLAPDDRVLEHTSALVWERSGDDAGEPIFRVGPVLRGKASQTTGDVTLCLGGLVQWRPGRQPHDPLLMLIVAPYLRDPDFAGPAPMVGAVVTVERDVLLGRKEPR